MSEVDKKVDQKWLPDYFESFISKWLPKNKQVKPDNVKEIKVFNESKINQSAEEIIKLSKLISEYNLAPQHKLNLLDSKLRFFEDSKEALQNQYVSFLEFKSENNLEGLKEIMKSLQEKVDLSTRKARKNYLKTLEQKEKLLKTAEQKDEYFKEVETKLEVIDCLLKGIEDSISKNELQIYINNHVNENIQEQVSIIIESLNDISEYIKRNEKW